MGFLNFVFDLILSFNGFLLVQSQQNQAQLQSPLPLTPPQVNTRPPPPPPPPALSPPPPPPRISKPRPPPPHSNKTKSPSRNHQPRRLRPPSPPPPSPVRIFKQLDKTGVSTGKTVGLLFAGFAAMLQICVVAFLVFKRKQLLRMTHTY